MNLFVEYVQPLTNWLQAHPYLALFITFLVSLSESLAIIGSIVPGSVTMTAIGILAGSGLMRIDLTLLAAILGAIAGDSLSYALGYYYSDKLTDMWPFSRYPTWLNYGKEFFNKHGGKSVLLGRFIGPLRSIIPVIAGIMHMKQWRFIAANVLSGILWSLLYVLPGILIGTASNELTPEGATKLILFILVSLAGIWLMSVVLKWLLLLLNNVLKDNLHKAWLGYKQHPLLHKIVSFITPTDEQDHYQTALLVLSTFLAMMLFVFFGFLSLKISWYSNYNIPVYWFVQSLRSNSLEAFFIFCTQLTSPITTSLLLIFWSVWFLKAGKRRPVHYAASLVLSSCFLIILLSYFIHTPRPQGFAVTMPGSAFPAVNLQLATALYGFVLFYISSYYTLLTTSFRSLILIILGLSGFGFIYLGDYWLTDILAAYSAGLTICLMHCLMYRRSSVRSKESRHSILLISAIIALLLIGSVLSTYVNYKTLKYNHTLNLKEYSIKKENWWNQNTPVLPVYLLNRIGQRTSLLNLEYSGDLDSLENSLESYGWKSHSENFFSKLLLRLNFQTKEIKLPLLDLLYDNKLPELVMTYNLPDSNLILELRFWESRYFLADSGRPIWIGSLHYNKKTLNRNLLSSHFIDPLTYVLPALNDYTLRRIQIPVAARRSTVITTSPYVLLIKQKRHANRP